MSEDRRDLYKTIFWIGGSFAFGFWMQSLAAGIFMFLAVPMLSELLRERTK